MHETDAGINIATDVASCYVMEVTWPVRTQNVSWVFDLVYKIKTKIKGQLGERAEKNDQFLQKK